MNSAAESMTKLQELSPTTLRMDSSPDKKGQETPNILRLRLHPLPEEQTLESIKTKAQDSELIQSHRPAQTADGRRRYSETKAKKRSLSFRMEAPDSSNREDPFPFSPLMTLAAKLDSDNLGSPKHSSQVPKHSPREAQPVIVFPMGDCETKPVINLSNNLRTSFRQKTKASGVSTRNS